MRARGKWLTGLLAALVFMLFAAIGFTVKVHASAAESDGVVSFDWTGRTLGADETFAFAADAEFSTAETADRKSVV